MPCSIYVKRVFTECSQIHSLDFLLCNNRVISDFWRTVNVWRIIDVWAEVWIDTKSNFLSQLKQLSVPIHEWMVRHVISALSIRCASMRWVEQRYWSQVASIIDGFEWSAMGCLPYEKDMIVACTNFDPSRYPTASWSPNTHIEMYSITTQPPFSYK